MESEKVKEIKESLQQEIHLTEYVDSAYSENVRLDLLKDVLTLINELESENEILRNAKVVYETVDYCYEDLKKAEKRIAELEKVYDRQLRIINDLNIEVVKMQEKLPKFAERLFEKYSYDKLTHENDEDIEIHLTASDLDETLKECINGKERK